MVRVEEYQIYKSETKCPGYILNGTQQFQADTT